MRHKNIENQRENQVHYAPKPQQKKKVPRGVTNFVMEKTSYGLGWTTRDTMTSEINPFLTC